MKILRGLKLFVVGMLATLVFLGLTPAGASSANLSHSYQAGGDIPNGSIVSLDPKHSDFVQLATTDNGSRVLGVALPSQDSLLAVDPSSTKVQVAISGSVDTLVSTLNGNIKLGDQVSVSPFGGIGMKAMSGSHVIGIAQTTFSQDTSGATTETVKDKAGKSQQIKLGFIRLTIAVGSAGTAGSGGAGGTAQLNFLQTLIKSLTGRTIPTIRILLSILVTIISLVSLVVLIYASIYGSIISIGRNPLAQKAIYRTLTSVMVMAVLTITIATAAVYYLLH